MRYSVNIRGTSRTLVIQRDDQQGWQVTLDGVPLQIDSQMISPGLYSLLSGTTSWQGVVRSLPAEEGVSDARRFEVSLNGQIYPVELVDERRRALTGSAKRRNDGGEITVKAPMPGLVVDVLVTPGTVVERNQRVAVLEAMKMQNDLTAPRAGVVKTVAVQKGVAVNQGQVLVVIGDASGD